MINTSLVPVFSGQINCQAVFLCSARDLHAFLEVGRDFTNWFKTRVIEYGFESGTDFISISPHQAKTEGGFSPNLAKTPPQFLPGVGRY